MSMNKMGSKLAQGVRQVMEQSKAPEGEKKQVEKQVNLQSAAVDTASKSSVAKVISKTLSVFSDDQADTLHPDRVWPD